MPKLSRAELEQVLDAIEKCKSARDICWPHKVAVAVSQLFNAILGGMPDETFSSRVYRKRLITNQLRYRILEKVIDTAFFYEHNHCFYAYYDELTQRHVHPYLISKRSNLKGNNYDL